jgi:hypothetical protein
MRMGISEKRLLQKLLVDDDPAGHMDLSDQPSR